MEQLPIQKLDLDRALIELKGTRNIVYGGGNGDKRWYHGLKDIDDPVVDLWKFALNFFYLHPDGNRLWLTKKLAKEYPEIDRPRYTMNRVVAMLCTQKRLAAKDGKWVILDAEFVPDKKYLYRNPNLPPLPSRQKQEAPAQE